ncbi:hypothetical protein BH10BDE1_BH10BDE1_17420 [soil metagenome]
MAYLTPADGNKDLSAKMALQGIVATRENEFDPQMLRALFRVLNLPLPDRIANIRPHG